jgi:hypothetical protein
MDKAFHIYNKAGFHVTTIHCNQEFKHLMDKISDDLDVEMNYTTTGKHVPEAEQNNWTLKSSGAKCSLPRFYGRVTLLLWDLFYGRAARATGPPF